MIDLALAILVVTLLAYHLLEARIWARERSELLNRVMARTYTDFVYTTTPSAEVDTSPVAPQPPDKAWHEENKRLHPDQYPDGETWD